ncbi:VaFE repeat-containing surface-anchored protein [Enterococcus gallinarum]|uniref:VaFE repeat-containing surface-anchored protein n=1 Tax=Enterococcus gallinarum TaxID=1353 RepID=UPI0018AB7E6E|nr:VaFE repeat-containing surface-anchored protein [Enterococcus gallinarum]
MEKQKTKRFSFQRLATWLMIVLTVGQATISPAMALAEEATDPAQQTVVSEVKAEEQALETTSSSQVEKTDKTSEDDSTHVPTTASLSENAKANDSPETEATEEVTQPSTQEKEQSVQDYLREQGYKMLEDGTITSTNGTAYREDYLSVVQEVKHMLNPNRISFRMARAATQSVFVDKNYGSSTIGFSQSNGNSELGWYLKRDASRTPLWCVEPGVPLNWGENPGFSTSEVSAEKYKRASLAAYWGFEKQKSVVNAFYTERLVQEIVTGTTTHGIYDYAGVASQDGYNTFKRNVQAKIDTFFTKPSFAGQTVEIKTGETKKLTDTNNVLSYYKVTAASDNITVSQSGNGLTIAQKDGNTNQKAKINFAYNIDVAYQGATILFQADWLQDVIKAGAGDPSFFSVNLNLQTAEIKTTAVDKEDKDKQLSPEKQVTITDAVGYTGLQIGKEYTVKGKLMDKATNKPLVVNGKEVIAEKTFKPTVLSGTLPLEFTFDGSALGGKTVVVFEDLYQDGKKVTSHSDINDKEQTVEFDQPEIGTTAKNVEDQSKAFDPEKQVTLVDTVAYKELQVGKTYKVAGKLMDKATSKPLLINGKEVTAEQTFVPKKATGTVDVTFTFDATSIRGKEIVVFENLSRQHSESKTWFDVTDHKDINDSGQTVKVTDPKIKTTAVNKEDKSKLFDPLDESLTLVDTVSYENLISGKQYTVKGKLMDKATNKPLVINGKEIIAEKTFVAEKATDTVDVVFTFNAKNLAGKTIVVFEDLYRNQTAIVSHADINDSGQTVKVTDPKIQTTATNQEDGSKLFDPLEEVILVDTVSYENLIPGKQYTVKGKLMDKETGEALLIDEKEVISEQTFVAEKATGTVDVIFTFNAVDLASKTIVVFEDLYRNDTKIAVHADIEDQAQTVEVTDPKIKTTATNQEDGSKLFDPLEQVTLVDTVSYENLIYGKEYKVKGKLMDKATNKPLLVDGKEVISEQRFIAGVGVIETPESKDAETSENAEMNEETTVAEEVIKKGTEAPEGAKESTRVSGTVDVTFTFHAKDLAGKTVVVFEDLTREDVLLTAHADIEDKGQTVTFQEPKIKTTATVDGKKAVEARKNITVQDEVTYTNLISGKEYTVKGKLMDKETGKVVVSNGKEVTAEKTFTPEKAEGTITLDFTFDGSHVTAEKEYVVFEDLYRDKDLLVSHADLNDQAQTITVKSQPKEGTLPKTGSAASTGLVILGIVILVGTGLYVVYRKKK